MRSQCSKARVGGGNAGNAGNVQSPTTCCEQSMMCQALRKIGPFKQVLIFNIHNHTISTPKTVDECEHMDLFSKNENTARKYVPNIITPDSQCQVAETSYEE